MIRWFEKLAGITELKEKVAKLEQDNKVKLMLIDNAAEIIICLQGGMLPTKYRERLLGCGLTHKEEDFFMYLSLFVKHP